MRIYRFDQFGLDHLTLGEAAAPTPRRGEVLLEVKALSLNYRDLMVVRGQYNPRLPLPATPISDAAGLVAAVGPDVTRVKVGERVMSHFIAGWLGGPLQERYRETTLGTPGPGLAAELVALPDEAVVPLPAGYDFAEAATLPIAALTAWSALRTVFEPERNEYHGGLRAARSKPAHLPGPGRTVLTLGTGGVSIFAVQLAKQIGATVIITSSSDEKLARARELGADHGINRTARPDWDKAVLELTGAPPGARPAVSGDASQAGSPGVDLTIENGGAGTLEQSMRATRAGGTIAMLGALTGLKGELNLGAILMKRLTIAGVFVDSREQFEELVRFLEQRQIRPVIDRRFRFEELPEAFRYMAAGRHFGKIVVTL